MDKNLNIPTLQDILNKIEDTSYNLEAKKISEYGAEEFALILLTIIATGAIVTTLATFPGIAYIYKLFDAKTPQERHRIYQTIRRYKKRKLITLKDGRIMTTKDGNRLLSTYQARNLCFKQPDTWDGKWRMVMFDIPGKYENERKIVREKLWELGFLKYQDSVFIFPYDCEDIITKLKTHLALDGFIRYITVQSFDKEFLYKKKFKLIE